MKKEDLGHKIFRAIYHYVLFFLLVAFLVTCSMMLFVSVLADTLQLNLTSKTYFWKCYFAECTFYGN